MTLVHQQLVYRVVVARLKEHPFLNLTVLKFFYSCMTSIPFLFSLLIVQLNLPFFVKWSKGLNYLLKVSATFYFLTDGKQRCLLLLCD